MGYNFEKQRHECDRCGKPIPSNQVVQLCKECDEWLEAQYKDKIDVIGYKLADEVNTIIQNQEEMDRIRTAHLFGTVGGCYTSNSTS